MNIGKRTHTIPASASGYAIAFMLLVGLITSGVLFISSTNKRLEINFAIQEHILLNNYVSIRHGANNSTPGEQLIVHSSGDSSMIYRKQWGAFRVVVAETFHSSRRVIKAALIGDQFDQSHPALYMPDQRQVLKLCGDTKIEGTVYLSERGVERGYIAGTNYKNDQLIYGEKRTSDRSLPRLSLEMTEQSLSKYIEGTSKIDFFTRDSSFSFSQPTTLVSQIEPLFIAQSISGNIILHSFDSIVVSSDARLQNVILISPKVRFEEGFKGSVQVIATEEIICEKNVHLNYPSALILNEKESSLSGKANGIYLKEGSRVLGGVLLYSQKPNFRKQIFLDVDHALIGGLVYNTGDTQLKGEIVGHLYTSNFDLQTGGGRYGNHLLDAKISSKKLPEGFVFPNWLMDEKIVKSVIVACF